MARSPSLPDLHPELTRSWLNRARSTDSYTKVNPHLPSLPSPRLPPVVTDHTNSAMISLLCVAVVISAHRYVAALQVACIPFLIATY